MSELIVRDDEHEHWWVLTAPRLVVSVGSDNKLANPAIDRPITHAKCRFPKIYTWHASFSTTVIG